MGWILQGSPKRFNIDSYVTRYPFVYWSAPTNQKDLAVGDRIFIWRSGPEAGVVAVGVVRERATTVAKVKHPEALGENLWAARRNAPSDVKVGVEVDEVRLTSNEGMVARRDVKAHRALGRHRIITQRQGTVFRLRSDEVAAMEHLWSSRSIPSWSGSAGVAMEGMLRLHSHYRRDAHAS
jgi:hypothetical protein